MSMRQLEVPEFFQDPPLDDSGAPLSWDSGTSQVSEFKKQFRLVAGTGQNHRCAFCILEIGVDIGNRSDDIEHFAPKRLYPQWTFERFNLMLACEVCNRRWKRTYDPIKKKHSDYEHCEFNIVHPYLDTVTEHIMGGYYNDLLEPTVPVAVTDKGRETILLFKLADPDRLKLWTKDYRSALWDTNPDAISRVVAAVMSDLENR